MKTLLMFCFMIFGVNCATNSAQVKEVGWHDGRPATSILCIGTPSDCIMQANTICPVGYETLDRKENGSNLNLIIRCK